VKVWRDMLKTALSIGEERKDRTGVGTLAVFGLAAMFDLREGFPAVTSKPLPFRQIRGELAAFLRGSESVDDFRALGCNYWDSNVAAWKGARYPGDAGRIYGAQWLRWRSWRPNVGGTFVIARETNQLEELVDGLRKSPHGRRHVVTAWQPGEMDLMCLPPCHIMFQCFASDDEGEYLDLQFYMRSVDLMLGAPCDIALYALLLHLIAKEVGRSPRRLLMVAGDAHVYLNHVDQARAVLRREPRALPALHLEEGASLFKFLPSQAGLVGYDPHDALPTPLNV
jgi:thymidylate synthase